MWQIFDYLQVFKYLLTNILMHKNILYSLGTQIYSYCHFFNFLNFYSLQIFQYAQIRGQKHYSYIYIYFLKIYSSPTSVAVGVDARWLVRRNTLLCFCCLTYLELVGIGATIYTRQTIKCLLYAKVFIDEPSRCLTSWYLQLSNWLDFVLFFSSVEVFLEIFEQWNFNIVTWFGKSTD